MERDYHVAPVRFEAIHSPSTHSPSENGQVNDHRRLIDIAESKPHPELWFDDGSLVIQASSIRYRIHRTIICKHSAVFRDMVAMPQPDGPSDAENTFDGCPLVRLSDSPDDLSLLLEAIYSNPDYFRKLRYKAANGDADIALEHISGILRLSTKYEFQAIRKEAIRVLEILNPIELDMFMVHNVPPNGLEESRVIKEMGRLFSIIELSKGCGLMQFLPSALYRISCLLAPDGSQDHLLIDSSEIDERFKSWCLSGRARIQKISIIAEELDIDCEKSHINSKGIASLAYPVAKTGLLFNKLEWSLKRRRCHKCILQAELEYHTRQQKAWGLLPEYFGFRGKSWSELIHSD